MEGEIIGRVLSQLPEEFKNLLKRKETGEITQQELENQCDAYTLSRLNSLDPKPEPTKPRELIDYDEMTKKEQKEQNIEKIKELKNHWQSSRLEIAIENEMNLRELRKLKKKYKNTPEAEKIMTVIERHKTFYPPFKEPMEKKEYEEQIQI